MTGSDVPDPDMPSFPPPPPTDLPGTSEQALGALFAALAGPPEPDELSGQEAALAAFRQHRPERAAPAAAGGPAPTRHAPPARYAPARQLAESLRARLAVAAGAVALLLGGVATAAYAGVLPAPVQRFAHATIGAPSPRPAAPSPSAPAGPGGDGGPGSATPAASRSGSSSSPGVAEDHPSGQATAHGDGKPSALPTPQAAEHGGPTAGPTPGKGKPTDLPTPPKHHGEPTGRPGG